MHKKFIKRDGKIFGPYYYENYRVGDKVKTIYLGTKPPQPRQRFSINRNLVFAIVLASVLFLMFYGKEFTMTGMITSNVTLNQTNYTLKTQMEGNVTIKIYLNDLIPENSTNKTISTVSLILWDAGHNVINESNMTLLDFILNSSNPNYNTTYANLTDVNYTQRSWENITWYGFRYGFNTGGPPVNYTVNITTFFPGITAPSPIGNYEFRLNVTWRNETATVNSARRWVVVNFTQNFTVTYDYNISACRNITEAGTYTFNNTITNWDAPNEGAACINVTVSDAEIDCIGNNFWIDGIDETNVVGIKSEGLSTAKLTNITTKNCNLTDWDYGDYYLRTENSTLANITTSSNTNTGVLLSASSNNNLSNINASGNSDTGVYFYSSSKNRVINNSITSNKRFGLYLNQSMLNNITGSRIENNSVSGYAGIYLFSHASTATSNSSYNRFWDNIINNTPNGGLNWKTYGINYTNYFNTTKVAGTNIIGGSWIAGNYWSDYTGTDADGDGIGDSILYVINSTAGPKTASNMTDALPLVYIVTSVTDYNISACRNITEAGTYKLNKSITNWDAPVEGAACINITASNVEVDCVGGNFWIDGIDETNVIGIKAEGLSTAKLTNASIKNCNLTDWYYGDYHLRTENSTLANITASSNANYGIYLNQNSNNNTLANITASSNPFGIYIYTSSNNNTLANINASSNSQDGINVGASLRNNLININASSNSQDGINIDSNSNYNQIINSTIKNNKDNGVYIYYARFNNITGNTIENNSVSGYAGIKIYSHATSETSNSSYNRFWNNLINNTPNGGLNWMTYGINYTNYFNTTKVAGTNIIGGSWIAGNYWSDYTGSDADVDGIGDTPYVINSTAGPKTAANETDNLPLLYALGSTGTCSNCQEGTTCTINSDCEMNVTSCSNQLCDFTRMFINASLRTGRTSPSSYNVENLWINVSGDLNITVNGRINATGMSTSSGAAGTGGRVNITARNVNSSGEISAAGGSSTGAGGAGAGGMLNITATEFIYLYNLTNSSAGKGGASGATGGNMWINATNDLLISKPLATIGTGSVSAGNISIGAAEFISYGSILTRSGSRGGNLKISALAATVTGVINTYGASSSAGGFVSINTTLNITVSNIDAYGGSTGGAGGEVSLNSTGGNITANETINAFGGSGAAGGHVLIKAYLGTANVSSGINVIGGVGGTTDGRGGNISVEAINISVHSVFNSSGGYRSGPSGNGGNAGDVREFYCADRYSGNHTISASGGKTTGIGGINGTDGVVRIVKGHSWCLGGDTVAPNITLVDPPNASTASSLSITFTYLVDDGSNIANCSLILNSTLNNTNSTPIVRGVNNTINVTFPGSGGKFNWTVNCTDSNNLIGTATPWQLTLPEITGTCVNCGEGSSCTLNTDCEMNVTSCSGQLCDFTSMFINASLRTGRTTPTGFNAADIWINVSGDLNITVNGRINATGLSTTTTAGVGGRVNISARNVNSSGEISAAGGSSTGAGAAGAGGMLNITATEFIYLYNVTNASAGKGTSGATGGNMWINATNDVLVSKPLATIGTGSVSAGNISIGAAEFVSYGSILTRSGSRGGNLKIFASAATVPGVINTYGASSSAGGFVSINTTLNITVSNIDAYGGSTGGAGGEVSLNSTGGNITANGTINAFGGGGTTGGAGGHVLMKAYKGDVNVSRGIETRGGAGSSGVGGRGGNISVSAINISVHNIFNSSGGATTAFVAGGNAGDIFEFYCTDRYSGNHTINAYGGKSSGGSPGANGVIRIVKGFSWCPGGDTVAPNITLIDPLNDSTASSLSTSFIYTVDDGSNIANCTLILNSTINNTNSTPVWKAVNLNSSINVTFFGEGGEFNWTVNCTDAGNYRGTALPPWILNVPPITGTCTNCSEGSSCTINTDCEMNVTSCSNQLCDFTSMFINASLRTGRTTPSSYNVENLWINVSGDLNITVNGRINASGMSANGAGTGGKVNITVRNLNSSGEISVAGGNRYTTGTPGSAGWLNISATEYVYLSNITNASSGGTAGVSSVTGGNIWINATNDLIVAVPLSTIGTYSGRGGNISIKSAEFISYGSILTRSGSSGGTGGGLWIDSSGVTVTGVISAYGAGSSAGGFVNINATYNITLSNLGAYGGSSGRGGNVSVNSSKGNVTINGTINAFGGSGAAAGDVLIYAHLGTANVSDGINVIGGVGGSSGGRGGNISVEAINISVHSVFNSSGGYNSISSGGNAGDVWELYCVGNYTGNHTVTLAGGGSPGTDGANGTYNISKGHAWCPAAAAANTCTPPSPGNWNIKCVDNCSLSNQEINIIPGNFSVYGALEGNVTFKNVNLTINKFNFNATKCKIYFVKPFKFNATR